MEAHALVVEKEFGAAREKFEALAEQLGSAETMSMTHSEVESLVESEGREVLRLLVQDHLDLRADVDAKTSARLPAVAGADAVIRTHRREQERPLLTLFVCVQRPPLRTVELGGVFGSARHGEIERRSVAHSKMGLGPRGRRWHARRKICSNGFGRRR